jgi:hypothetical protein
MSCLWLLVRRCCRNYMKRNIASRHHIRRRHSIHSHGRPSLVVDGAPATDCNALSRCLSDGASIRADLGFGRGAKVPAGPTSGSPELGLCSSVRPCSSWHVRFHPVGHILIFQPFRVLRYLRAKKADCLFSFFLGLDFIYLAYQLRADNR